jgi:hypothetical protein
LAKAIFVTSKLETALHEQSAHLCGRGVQEIARPRSRGTCDEPRDYGNDEPANPHHDSIPAPFSTGYV